ncbi:MAG: hypothetical protein J1E39_09400 [Eubacterium sp.]|nr:hypothetical protein [Eubacterium sp.]
MTFNFIGINIYSKKPEVVFEFYKKLGFRAVEECSPDDPWYGATLALQDDKDEPVIWIWRLGDNDSVAACNHFVFSANGKMDELYENIISAGIECDPPHTADWGGRELSLCDPEGNELLFL